MHSAWLSRHMDHSWVVCSFAHCLEKNQCVQPSHSGLHNSMNTRANDSTVTLYIQSMTISYIRMNTVHITNAHFDLLVQFDPINLNPKDWNASLKRRQGNSFCLQFVVFDELKMNLFILDLVQKCQILHIFISIQFDMFTFDSFNILSNIVLKSLQAIRKINWCFDSVEEKWCCKFWLTTFGRPKKHRNKTQTCLTLQWAIVKLNEWINQKQKRSSVQWI